MNGNEIAQLDLEILHPTKATRERVRLVIESPVCESERQWSCSVSDPQSKERIKVYGVDSLQSLALGMGCLGKRMNVMSQEGFRWVYAETDDDFPLAAYFPLDG